MKTASPEEDAQSCATSWETQYREATSEDDGIIIKNVSQGLKIYVLQIA